MDSMRSVSIRKGSFRPRDQTASDSSRAMLWISFNNKGDGSVAADRSKHPIVHFVGSIPLPDTETVFRILSAATGPHLVRLPDGETGIRKTWIRFLQDVLAQHPAIELAADVAPFRFTQWDGKVLREIPRLRLKPGAKPDPNGFKTGYADMAIESWTVFDRMQKSGAIPAGLKFQVCLPTPVAPTYNNMVPSDRPGILPALTQHFANEVAKIATAIPHERLAIHGTFARRCWPGRVTTTKARSTSVTRPLMCSPRSATPCQPQSSSVITCATA